MSKFKEYLEAAQSLDVRRWIAEAIDDLRKRKQFSDEEIYKEVDKILSYSHAKNKLTREGITPSKAKQFLFDNIKKDFEQ